MTYCTTHAENNDVWPLLSCLPMHQLAIHLLKPVRHAKDNGVILSLLAVLGSTACCNNTYTQTSCPSSHAAYKGVVLSLLEISCQTSSEYLVLPSPWKFYWYR